jgi:hypothetical protein
MRSLAYLLIALGSILLLLAAYDEHREIASVMAPSRSMILIIVKKSDNPQEFRNLMTYQWLRGFFLLGAGVIILGIVRRADRLDPFSPDFVGKTEVDKLGQMLDEKKKREPVHDDDYA